MRARTARAVVYMSVKAWEIVSYFFLREEEDY
jgi:hypothetical protein